MNIKQHIPNFFTLINALCGGMAILFIMQNEIALACLMVVIAAVVDFLDGFVARAFKVTSELGKQLDSLSDVVSFGVVPAFFAYYLFNIAYNLDALKHESMLDIVQHTTTHFNFLAIIPLIIIPFSAYRLGKFNLDTRQSLGFLGLPTPANGLFWTGLAFAQYSYASGKTSVVLDAIHPLLMNYWLILALSVIFAILLVTEIPLFAMKFKSYGWKGNEIKFIFLGLSLLLLILMPFVALPIIIIMYILLSIINNFITRNHELRS